MATAKLHCKIENQFESSAYCHPISTIFQLASKTGKILFTD